MDSDSSDEGKKVSRQDRRREESERLAVARAKQIERSKKRAAARKVWRVEKKADTKTVQKVQQSWMEGGPPPAENVDLGGLSD